MRRVLIVSFDFPPARTSGVYRPTKFVKHLRSFGWEPSIVCAKNPTTTHTDVTLLKDIPKDIRVERATVIDFSQLSASIHDAIFGRPPERQDAKHLENRKPPDAIGNTQRESKPGFLKRVILTPIRKFVETWLFVPDSKAGWIPFAFAKARKIVKQENPDVIFTTSAPPSTQIVGLLLRWLYRKPWIVDLRDNWAVGYLHNYSSSKRVHLDMWIFKHILKRADYVVTMSEGNGADIIAAFPQIKGMRVKAITNGYDEDDFTGLTTERSESGSSKLRLLHMGTLYGRTGGVFFDALGDLAAEDPEIEKKLQVDFVGPKPTTYWKRIVDLGLEPVVNLMGFKTHPDAIREMMAADVLLMFLGGEKIMNQQFPGKFFEYVRTRRPILTVGDRGEIIDAVKRCQSGFSVPFDDKVAIKEALKDLITAKESNDIKSVGSEKEFSVYEYKNLTGELVKVLEDVAGRKVVTLARAD